MKKVLWVLALCIFSGNALFAQSFPGTWQGALKVPQAPERRISHRPEDLDDSGG